MNKVLISILGLVALAGCSTHYDYYKGNVRYTQEGSDCVYYAGERGRRFSDEVRGLDKGQKVVYRNTFCANLFDKDTGSQYRNARQVLAPAAADAPCNSCACKSGCSNAAPVMKRRYVIVSNM
jgi:hypothetical protein